MYFQSVQKIILVLVRKFKIETYDEKYEGLCYYKSPFNYESANDR